jgi:diguanylate cyclase (GGDEF)-like protein
MSVPDLRDERALLRVLTSSTWAAMAVVAGIGVALPGTPHLHVTTFVIVDSLFALYAVASFRNWIPWTTMGGLGQALWTGVMLPALGIAIWATGGADSFAQPLVLFPLLQITYFFELRRAIPLVGLAVAAFASPAIYASANGQHVYPARALVVALGAVFMTYFVRLLKTRLIDAERRQREMALTDPLTGLANRRAFDDTLALAIVDRGEFAFGRRASDDDTADAALLLMDLDDFKAVNDTRGHAAGDELLRAVAAHCHAVVRPGDMVARIGGDEFAVIAFGAGRAGAERLAADLAEAIEHAGTSATIAWATHPDDGHDQEALLRAADRRLYDGKAERRKFAPGHSLQSA